MVKKLSISALSLFGLMQLWGFAVYGVFFKEFVDANLYIWRGMNSFEWKVLLPMAQAVYAWLLAGFVQLLYLRGLRYNQFYLSIFLYILTLFFTEIINYIIFPNPIKVMLSGVIYGFLVFISWGAVLKFVNR